MDWIVLQTFRISGIERDQNIGQRKAKLNLQRYLMKVIHKFKTKTNVFSSCLELT